MERSIKKASCGFQCEFGSPVAFNLYGTKFFNLRPP